MRRWVLLLSLALFWINYALTSRWADVVGSIHGSKEPVFLAILTVATLAALRGWRERAVPRWVSPAVFAAGAGLLVVSFFQWFPPSTWNQLPFLDNWATRFQVTVEGLELYGRGVATGWRWAFLGGYPTSTDISQTLSTIGAVPMLLFGDRIGFHLIHLLVLVGLPVLLYLDLRLDAEDRSIAGLAAGLAALLVTGWFSYFMTRSGDTNSMAGVFCAVAALLGSHAAAAGRRWGAPLLVGAMALMGQCHTAFIVYTGAILAVESLFYRDPRRLLRAGIGVAAAILTALPLTWESWRYPDFVNVSNAAHPSPPFVWGEFFKRVYYNVEIMFLPHRWFNDFTGVLKIMLPAILFVAARPRGRAAFFAWATLTVLALRFLDDPVFGFAFLRPIHLFPLVVAPPLAAFLYRLKAPALVLATFVALLGAYVQVSWNPVPHAADRRDLDPALVEYVRTLDGALVLFENAYHRDMDGSLQRVSERTPFQVHGEATLARETGKRFYAGLWDGWQWSVFRDNLLAGGAFKARMLSLWAPDDVAAELRKWGVRHVVVFSDAAQSFFSAHPDYRERWREGRWVAYEFLHADTRSVVTAAGAGTLGDMDWLGASVDLSDVHANDEVVVRTNYYPAWTAVADGQPVPLYARDRQLAFKAPRDGTYRVTLEYPRRRWLLAVAALALVLAIVMCARVRAQPDTRPI